MPHFRMAPLRRFGGWDAWNVTEDIDLGLRLERVGYRSGVLNSTTSAEAPITYAAWRGQRRRWLKGWMETLLVRWRRPRRALRDDGFRGTFSIFGLVASPLAGMLSAPAILIVTTMFVTSRNITRPMDLQSLLSDSLVFFVLGIGTVSMFWPAILGIYRRKLKREGKVAPLLPLYFLAMTETCWRALFELWRDPQNWTKTQHGLAQRRNHVAPDGPPQPPVSPAGLSHARPQDN
jgi:glycosyltransferase XagB